MLFYRPYSDAEGDGCRLGNPVLHSDLHGTQKIMCTACNFLIFNKVIGKIIWSSGDFFVTLGVHKQTVMNVIKPLDQKTFIGAEALNDATKVQNNSESKKSIWDSLLIFAQSVPDFRRNGKGNFRHVLADMLVLIMLARMSGHYVRPSIIAFGKHNLNKFQKKGLLLNGVPSEATLCRVDNGIDDLELADRMRQFMEAFYNELISMACVMEVICVDGKAMRGTVLENGRNPDIVSAYSYTTRIVLATEACREKSNEIKATPLVIDKIDVEGKVVTADAMSMQKDIVDKIKEKGGDFLIELKANRRSLRYGVEDRLNTAEPLHRYTYGPELGHGRIETRTYIVYSGSDLVVDEKKWGRDLTVIEYISETIEKSTGRKTSEKRLYVTSLSHDNPLLGEFIRRHWSVESMHWMVDVNLHQDQIKRKHSRAARNLDTIQRILYSLFSIWKGLRKKKADKKKGMTELMREISFSFTLLMRFLSQK